MDQTMLRMMELSGQGYYCSQILLMLALEAQEKTNHDLIRAVGGLANGCGFSGGSCGALTGAACLLSLYAGKGKDDEDQDESLAGLLQDLGVWFSRTYGDRYGGITCEAIAGDRTEIRQRCPAIVAETYAKTMELLAANGYDMTTGK